MKQTVLLPFKGMIVYDGLLRSYRISFGPGIRRSLNESFKEAKTRHGIVTSLPMSEQPMVPTKVPKKKSRLRKKPKEPSADVLASCSQIATQCLNGYRDSSWGSERLPFLKSPVDPD